MAPKRQSARRLKTARCLLARGSTFLLVMHQTWRGRPRGLWGLPGGRIEVGEDAESAVRRELVEELDVRIGAVTKLGDWHYKGGRHRVYGAELDAALGRIDRSEIADVAWLTLEDIASLARANRLHAGFELDAAVRLSELRETH